jgi:4-diphosphocytidyl-2-C-methyl-D-erythritol kinase
MRGASLALAAPAKINLYLKIIGRRADGYHELQTLMQKIALYDRLELTLTSRPGISLSCPESDLPEDEGNIVYRAAACFLQQQTAYCGGVDIILQKNIPQAAGLGGGSSDAAAVLRALNKLLDFPCNRDELASMGLTLGADVPFFVNDTTAAWATGVGERIDTVVPLQDYLILLVNPSIPVSTKWAYETFALTAGKNIFNLTNSQFDDNEPDLGAIFRSRTIRPKELFNDLEQVTVERYPLLNEIKDQLTGSGARAAMMSGSGPTVFGLFAARQAAEANRCMHMFTQEYSQVFLVAPLAESVA